MLDFSGYIILDYSGLLLSWNIASEWNEGIKLFPPLCYSLVPIYPTPKEEAFQLRDIDYLLVPHLNKKGNFIQSGEAEKAFGLRFDQFTSKILYIWTHFYCYINPSHLSFP